MNWLERRKAKKYVRQLLHDAHHARHMREDIAEAAQIEELDSAADALRAAWAERDAERIERAGESLTARIVAVYPPKNSPRMREYVEIAVVALAVAMAFRTYFVQPFKIPTGSMQPTLYGIIAEPQLSRSLGDRFPLNAVTFALFGERYVEIKAARDGRITGMAETEDGMKGSRDGIVPLYRKGLAEHFIEGQQVQKGQVLATGRVRSGDHIFVNKIRYNYTRPKRGDVFVFSTKGIAYPNVRPDSFYIKRLVALPDETIGIDPPYLLVDGERVVEPDVFIRQVHRKDLGYDGYVIPRFTVPVRMYLSSERVRRLLGPDEYLPLGDNTTASLDGRYFGPVKQENIVGPAFMVYWPLGARWGAIR